MESSEWFKLDIAEKDKLVAMNVMGLNYFNSPESIDWYQQHYELGLWHYTSNIQDANKILQKLSEENKKVTIHMLSQNVFHCCFYENEGDTKSFISSNSLSDAICLAAIQYKKKELQKK
ncbi:hypothetical protein R50345_08800 [Paenibacillus sp. FSL R5-0345]|uniref:BC1872 family protein n=1 Tax=Paenibacillus sp. FSL R5-0345 TaxID=1536770 RepID=UPI0004F7D9B0|nr:hypothetical protein [Paenibacillus sp. FSL R5-0345]AIQ34701.1 hypothetical protein R50345_08800 [Paenibacillus sp. FSL R5-0345]